MPTNLPAHLRERFEHWDRLILEEHDKIESIFRAILDKDADAFLTRLAVLHPGETGRMVTVVLLCKLASSVLYLKQVEVAGRPRKEGGNFTDLRAPILHLYEDMTRRFSLDEIETLWKRFSVLDQKLQSDGPQLLAGTQAKSAEYRVLRDARELLARELYRQLVTSRANVSKQGDNSQPSTE